MRKYKKCSDTDSFYRRSEHFDIIQIIKRLNISKLIIPR